MITHFISYDRSIKHSDIKQVTKKYMNLTLYSIHIHMYRPTLKQQCNVMWTMHVIML